MINTVKESRNLTIIGILSVAIPLVVAILLFMPSKLDLDATWISFLPHLNGVLNTATSITLIAGLIFIKQKKISYHKTAMLSSFVLGSIFLISYVIYHAAAENTVFGDANGNAILEATEAASVSMARPIYLVILFTHIVLAAIVVPFVLLALYYALTGKFVQHRKIVKFAYPIWLYVSVTGVIVYLMISQYY